MERTTPEAEPLGREVWLVASVVIVGVIMSILDTTIVNVALETLSRELHAPLSTIQWVSTGYLLSLALVIPLAGWMTERYGAKTVWMTSVALFGFGSMLCGAAWNAESLIVFRVLQGLGGGMIMPVGMTVMAQVAGPNRVGRVMSVIGVPMLLGPILGPVIGGLIVDNWSWRWIFYVNVPIVAVALVLASRILHADHGRADAGRLDTVGLALISPGSALIVYGLSQSETHGGFSAAAVWVPVGIGAVLTALFVRHAWFADRPLIDVKLFKEGAFGAAGAASFMLGGALFGTLLILPLYYQVARGEDALTAGLLMAPQGVGAAMAMPLAGRLTDRIGGGKVALVGIVVMTLGKLPYAFVTDTTPYWLLAGLLVIRGIGLGSSMMPTMAAAYACLKKEAVPRATSALNVTRQIGGSIGTAILAVYLQGQIKDALGAGGSGGGGLQQIAEPVRLSHSAAISEAFANTFLIAILMSVVAIIPIAVLAWNTRGRPGEYAEPHVAPEQAPAPVHGGTRTAA